MRPVGIVAAVIVLAACAGGQDPHLLRACGEVVELKGGVNQLAELRGDMAQLGRASGIVLEDARDVRDAATRADHGQLKRLADQLIQMLPSAISRGAFGSASGLPTAAAVDPLVQDMLEVCRQAGVI